MAKFACRAQKALAERAKPDTKIILNADDLGLARCIDTAIIRLAEAGRLTSASLTPVGRSFEEAAAWASSQNKISIGVHLSLTDRLYPATAASSLVGLDGRFPTLHHIAMRALLRKLPIEDIRKEWKAQIQKVIAAGVSPTHLDSHQHVHLLPGISEVAIDLAKEHNLPIRHTSGPFAFSLATCWNCPWYLPTLCRPGVWKSYLLRTLGKDFKRRLHEEEIQSTDSYVSPSSLCGRMRCETSHETVKTIAHLASENGGIVEWVTHPADVDDTLDEPAWMRRMRASETALLTDRTYP